MEKLIVENFLTIEQAELEVGRMTVIIGPQASGKSVLAKLVHMFRGFWYNEFLNAIEDPESDRTPGELLKIKFESLFPPYAWSTQHFSIAYKTAHTQVSISQPLGAEKNQLNVHIPTDLTELFTERHNEIKNLLLDTEEHAENFQQRIQDADARAIQSLSNFDLTKATRFIPASRSFFAYLQTNLFALARTGFYLDPLLSAFGTSYEGARRFYNTKSDDSQSANHEALTTEIESILGGKYQRDKTQDWIASGERRVMLQHASSGQQEALPMLVILANTFRAKIPRSFIIEEPEAHLFPTAQKALVNIFSLLHEEHSDFLLTTHSPYILSALNVLIQADDVIRQKPETAARVRELLGNGRPIAYEDVRVYALRDGRLTLEMNPENKLIGENVIDEVSTEFEHIFNELLTLQYPPDDLA